MLKKITAGLVLGAALLAGGAAQAQSWGNYDRGYGNGYGYQRDWREQRDIDRTLVESTCSGQRGQAIEARLQREVWEGDIDRRTAARLQWEIDRLQDRERHECRERDFREARDIGKQYVRIRALIDQQTGDGYRSRGRGW